MSENFVKYGKFGPKGPFDPLWYYDPYSATFLTKDPLGPHQGGDINPYRYVRNNPVNAVDPYGLDSYLVSRTNNFPPAGMIGNHNFIVVEDPSARSAQVLSFANSNGYLPGGNLVRDIGGATNRADMASLAAGSGVAGVRIDAADNTVLEVANGLRSSPYGYFGPNSNTAAQFIADVSQGSPVGTPSAPGTALGVVGAGAYYTNQLVGSCRGR